jgi:hypothetical protein
VCGVVVEEASREVEVTGSNHGNRGASRLYAKKCATCDGDGWVAGTKKCGNHDALAKQSMDDTS